MFSKASVTSEDQRAVERLTQAKRGSRLLLQIKLLLVVTLPVIAMIAISGRVLYEVVGQHTQTEYAQVTSVATEATDDLVLRFRVERALSVEFFMSTGSKESWSRMSEARTQTDHSLLVLPSWGRPLEVGNMSFSAKQPFLDYLNQQRKLVDSFALDYIEVLTNYQLIVTGFVGTLQSSRELPYNGDLWPLLVSFDSMLRALDIADTQKSLGDVFLRSCRADRNDLAWFWYLDGKVTSLLQQAFNCYSTITQTYDQGFVSIGLRDALEVDRPQVFSTDYADTCRNHSTDWMSQRNNSIWSETMTKHLEALRRIEVLIEKQTVHIIGEVSM